MLDLRVSPPAAADCEMKFYIKPGVFFLSLFYIARIHVSLFSRFFSCRRFFSHVRPRALYIYVPIDRYIGVCIYIDAACFSHDDAMIYALSGGTKNAYLSRGLRIFTII